MSSAARAEAIEIVRLELERRNPDDGSYLAEATDVVDKLLETHALTRRGPRLHRATSTPPPRALPGQQPRERTRL